MISNMSNNSDDEDKSNIQNCLQESNMIYKRFKKEPDANEIINNDLVNFHQESYVKEEVMIPDTSDLYENEVLNSDNSILQNNTILFTRFEKSNNNYSSCDENIETIRATENSDDEEIDVVNVSEHDKTKLHQMINSSTCKSRALKITTKSNIIEPNNIIRKKNLSSLNVKRSSPRKQRRIKKDKLTSIKDQIVTNLIEENTAKDMIESTVNQTVATINLTVTEVVSKSDVNVKRKHFMLKYAENTSMEKCMYHTEQNRQKITHTSLKECSVRIEKLSNFVVNKHNLGSSLSRLIEKKTDLLGSTTVLVCRTCNSMKESVSNPSKAQCQKCREPMEYRCLKCAALHTTSIATVYFHLKRQCGQKEFQRCQQCDYRTMIRDKLHRHVLLEHTLKSDEEGFVECAKCGGAYKGRKQILQHLSICSLERFLRCKFCKFTTKYCLSFRRHLKGMHKRDPEEIRKIIDEARTEKCTSASETTNNEPEVDPKPKTLNSKEYVKLYCSKCDMNFEKNTRNARKCHLCGTAAHLQCLKCARRYLDPNCMNRHLRTKCGPIEYFQCDNCDYNVTTKERLRLHIEVMHTTVAPEDYLKCRKCGKGFKHRFNQKAYEKQCGREPYLQCEFCPLRSKTLAYFKIHVQNHMLHPENGNETVGAGSKDGIAGDAMGITDNTSKPNKENVSFTTKPMSKKEKSRIQELVNAHCPKCKRKTKAIDGVRKCTKCSTKYTFHCGECGKKYPVQSTVRQHIISKHLGSELKKRQQCPKCGTRFVLKYRLSTHLEYCGREPSFQCDNCPRKFKYKSSLVDHMQKHHSKLTKSEILALKIHICQGCGKKYQAKRGLDWHRQIFCGKKRSPTIACAHCSFKSYTKQQLMAHLHEAHLRLFTVEALKCKLCGKENSNVYMHATHVKNCCFK